MWWLLWPAPTPATGPLALAPSTALYHLGTRLDTQRHPAAPEVRARASEVSAMEAEVRRLTDENRRLTLTLAEIERNEREGAEMAERASPRAARELAIAEGLVTPIEPFLARRNARRMFAIDGGAA